ncbi:MAG: hypothetical protein WC737_03315 [Parcubacteria group bacterium]|jgi:hypothetical protein
MEKDFQKWHNKKKDIHENKKIPLKNKTLLVEGISEAEAHL